MPTSNARLGAGNVEIELDGEKAILRPTLRAAQTLSRQNGGISAAIQAVGSYNLDTLIEVITVGLDLKGKDANDLPDKIWRTGMVKLSAPAIRYLSILSNGGRPLGGEDGDETDPPNG